ncbi:MAG: hypothetical protein AAGH41_11320 [Pseudomonadota bacterium]
MKTALSIAATLLMASNASAAYFPLTFYDVGSSKDPVAPDRSEENVLARGTMFVDDDQLVANNFIDWRDRDSLWIRVEWFTDVGAFVYDSRVSFLSGGAAFGLLLDDAGNPLRFDAPDTSVSNAFVIFEDSSAAPVFPGNYINIWDDDDFNFGFLDEDVFLPGTTTPFIPKDTRVELNPAIMEFAFTPIANRIDFVADVGNFGFQTNVVIGAAQPVPLPAPVLLMASGLGLAWLKKRRDRNIMWS